MARPSMFAERQTAWGSAMTAGSGPEKSGSCGGCDSGAPCSSCGSDAENPTPAQQALSWGLMQAESRPGMSQFWKVATVGQAVRDAPGRTDNGDWRSVDAALRLSESALAALAQGPNASYAWASTRFLSVSLTPPPLGTTVAAETPSRGGGGPGAKTPPKSLRRCCVEKFCYPKTIQLVVATGKDGTTNVGVIFTFEAKYVEDENLEFSEMMAVVSGGWEYPGRAWYQPDASTEDPWGPGDPPTLCACECCKFEQWVEYRDTTGTQPNEPDDTPGWHLDCVWIGPNGEKLNESQIRNSEYGGMMPGDWVRICFGDSHRPSNDYERFYLGQEGTDLRTKCAHTGKDHPNMPVSGSGAFAVEFAFRGIIHDTCRGVDVRLKTFSVRIEGQSPWDYQGTYSSEDSETEQILPDDGKPHEYDTEC